MAAHRKPKQRTLSSRTALTLALAGVAGATAFEGSGHAEPRLTPAQVKARADRLYQEAEEATDKYNGAKEEVRRAEASLEALRDEAARRTARLNAARDALGSMATASTGTAASTPPSSSPSPPTPTRTYEAPPSRNGSATGGPPPSPPPAARSPNSPGYAPRPPAGCVS